MRDRISILVKLIPRYGEILLGVGCMALENSQELIENSAAREELKRFLITEAPKHKTLIGVAKCDLFNYIVYKYTGKHAAMGVIKDDENNDKKVNILLLDFFNKSLWPILVKRYMDSIYDGIEHVKISINVKKNVYLTIYEEDNPDLLFKEIKEFLLCNYIVISKADIQQNGDILLELIVPIPPHKKYTY